MSKSWYNRFLPSGDHVVSGAGTLFLDGHELHERETPVRGWQPVPFDVPDEPDRWFAYNGGPGLGLRLFDLWAMQSSSIDGRELIELAAGGGVVVGRHAPTKTLVVLRRQSDGRWLKSEIANAGQPAVGSDGSLIYRTGDDKIEPSICLTAEAWGDGNGHIFAKLRGQTKADDVTVGSRESRVVLVDTPQGPWAVTMTKDSLNVRPLFGVLGYRPPEAKMGNNRNLHAHAIYRADKDELWAVWQDTDGNRFEHHFSLSAPRVDLRDAPPIVVPPPPPPPPPDEVTMFPEKLKNGVRLKDFINQALRETGLIGHGANEQARRDSAARAIAHAAHAANQIEGREVYGLRSKHRGGWSKLALKAGGEVGVYSDLLAYRDPFLSVDVVTGAESSNAGVGGWTHQGPVTDDRHRFVAPSELTLIGAGPIPDPEPGDTHLYIGGGNDTGKCDECGRSRFDDVHKIPESFIQHGYDPGEDGIGLCDICQQEAGASIHQLVPTPEDPPDDDDDDDPELPDDAVATLRLILASNLRQENLLEQLRVDVVTATKDLGEAVKGGGLGGLFGRRAK